MEAEFLTVGDIAGALKVLPDDMPVVYSCDDEGNSFHPVLKLPGTLKLADIKDSMYPLDEERLKRFNKVVWIN